MFRLFRSARSFQFPSSVRLHPTSFPLALPAQFSLCALWSRTVAIFVCGNARCRRTPPCRLAATSPQKNGGKFCYFTVQVEQKICPNCQVSGPHPSRQKHLAEQELPLRQGALARRITPPSVRGDAAPQAAGGSTRPRVPAPSALPAVPALSVVSVDSVVSVAPPVLLILPVFCPRPLPSHSTPFLSRPNCLVSGRHWRRGGHPLES